MNLLLRNDILVNTKTTELLNVKLIIYLVLSRIDYRGLVFSDINSTYILNK